MGPRIASYGLLGIGLALSVATSSVKTPDPVVDSAPASVSGEVLAAGAPVLVRLDVTQEGKFIAEMGEGETREVTPEMQVQVGFHTVMWEAVEGGVLTLHEGEEGSCEGRGGSVQYPVPGEDDDFAAPSNTDIDTEIDTRFVLAMVTGDAVYDGPLTFRVRLTGRGEVGELVQAEDVKVSIVATLMPLDCRVEPEGEDTGADTAIP